MSAEEPPVSPVVKSNKRMRRRRWIAYAAGGAFVATGLGIAVGPAAPWMVERLDGQRIWRLGRIDIDGVSGGWLGALHADHVTIEDEEGVWLEANNLSLNWRPQDLLGGAVRIVDRDGTVLAAVSFDRTGTTRIGSWVINHSFMRPGLVTTIVATCASLALARLVFG